MAQQKITQPTGTSTDYGRLASETEFAAKVGSAVQLKKAALSDAPLIFRLMLEGSITGSFTDRYLQDAGHLNLLAWILRDLVPRPRWTRKNSGFAETSLVRHGEVDIGFIQLTQIRLASGEWVTTINLFAIAKAHQNRGLGSSTVTAVMDALPPNAILVAYCTKYARAMQHVLTKLHFKREKPMIGNLTRFSWQKN